MNEEMKSLLTELKTTFEAFKGQVNQEEVEVKQQGAATAETAQIIDRMNARMNEIEVKLARPGVGSAVSQDEVKAAIAAEIRHFATKGFLPSEAKALVQDANGEILVPEQVEAELLTEIRENGELRALADVRTIGTNRQTIKKLTGVQVGWNKLETSATAPVGDALSASEDEIRVWNQVGRALLGVDELADSSFDLVGFLTTEFGFEMAEAEEEGIVNGTGVNQMTGLLAGTTLARVAAGQAGGLKADDFISLQYALGKAYRKNGVFILSSSTEAYARKLKDANGAFMWQPALAAGRPATLLGRPVYNSEVMAGVPAAGTAADVAIYTDLKRCYRIVDRAGVSIQRLSEKYIEEGKIGFLATRRVGGDIIRPAAGAVLKVPAA